MRLFSSRVALLGATLLSGALTVVGGTVAVQAKTLVYCSEGSPEGFDAALYSTNSTWDASSETVYDRLTEFKAGTTEIVPGLAESWTISDDNLEYVLNLREGVQFQKTDYFTPSRAFNADDVLFSYNRQIDKTSPWYNYTGMGNWEMFDAMEMGKIVKEIVKVDDHTVKFVLNQPDASLLAKLALNFGVILSAEYAGQLEKSGNQLDLDHKPVGTGPFVFNAYQQDAVIRFAANPDYWGGKPKIDTLIFAITVDSTTRMQRLKAGECQIAPYPAPADVEGLKADPSLTVLEQPGLNVAYMSYNTLVAPFDKVEVRKALNMAINRQAIVDSIYQGFGQVAQTGVPPIMWSYNRAIKGPVYDPEQAKKMLDEAGVKDLNMKIWAMPVARPYMPNARRTAEMMQADLAQVGVKVEIVSYEWGEYLKKSRDKARDGAVILGATSDNGDPDNMLSFFFVCSAIGSSNMSNWCYKPVDDLLQQGRVTSDAAKRKEIYEKAQEDIDEQAPWLPIAHSTVVLPMSKKVKNFVMEPLGSHRFKNVDLDE